MQTSVRSIESVFFFFFFFFFFGGGGGGWEAEGFSTEITYDG